MSNYVNDMTNEEIFEMLQPKLLKNYIFPNNVSEAVGMAYRVGYLRAMKGRPFKIGEKKKKKGHWKPVDSNNLPKEGTKVRYSRECPEYKNNPKFITLGETGVFAYGKYTGSPGIKPDGNLLYPWVSFNNCVGCLDMWVEDDE